VRTVLDQEGTLRLVQINGVPHVIAAHTVLAQRSQRPGRRHAGVRAPHRRAGIASIGADTSSTCHFAMLDDPLVSPRKPDLLSRPTAAHRAPLGQRHRRPAAPRHHRQSSARGDVHHAAAHGDAERQAGCALPRRAGSRC
jgi:hypothetical protein